MTRCKVGCQFLKPGNICEQRNLDLGEPLLRGFLAGRTQILEEIDQQTFTGNFIRNRFNFIIAIFVADRCGDATRGHVEQITGEKYTVSGLSVVGDKTSIVEQVVAFRLGCEIVVGKVLIQGRREHIDRHTTVAAVATGNRACNRIHDRRID